MDSFLKKNEKEVLLSLGSEYMRKKDILESSDLSRGSIDSHLLISTHNSHAML